jgi:sugar phosphate permease
MFHALRGEYFGRRAFGTITGLSGLIMSVGMMGAPVVVGWVFDVYGTYRWAFIVLACAAVLGSFVVLLATRPDSPIPEQRGNTPG